MLDLRGNNGGDLGLTYHFLSLFLGNNDPDIYPLPVPNNQKLSYEDLNNKLKSTTLPPFYQCTLFDSVTLTKNSSEDITFKKMVVLVDGKTFSSGEIVQPHSRIHSERKSAFSVSHVSALLNKRTKHQ